MSKPTSNGNISSDSTNCQGISDALKASRERKRQYVQQLEKTIHILTTDKVELQVKVATLTNQLWEQSLKIDQLEKELVVFTHQQNKGLMRK